MLNIIFALFVLLVASPVLAATKYVDSTPGANCVGNYNPGTRTCTAGGTFDSWTTIENGMTNMGASNTLIIRAGAYSGNGVVHPPSGTAQAYSIVQNQPGEAYSWTKTGGSTSALVYTNGQPYFKITCDVLYNCILDGNNYDSTDVNEIGLIVSFGTTDVIIERLEIRNVRSNGIYTDSDRWVIRGNDIHGTGDGTSPGHRGHSMYLESDSHLAEFNILRDAYGVGIHCFSGVSGKSCDNSVFQYNRINNVGIGAVTVLSAITIDGGNNIAYRNTIRCGSIVGVENALHRGIDLYRFDTTADNNKIYHNDVTRCGAAITNEASTSQNNEIKNNALYLNNSGITDAGTGTVLAGNFNNSTNPSWADADNNNFTLLAGSAAIDAGAQITGYQFNGTNPDVGAHEPPRFSTCTVEDGDASTMRVTFQDSVAPPLLPANSITGFTTRKNGSNNAITGTQRTGTNRIDLSLAGAVANGNTIDVSYSSGNLTDSALIGGTRNQPYIQTLTQQSCTNNVGAASSAVFTQTVFRFNGLRGTEAAPVATPYAAAPENTNIFVVAGGFVRLRVGISCTVADCPIKGFLPYYKIDGGTSTTLVTDNFTADGIAFCGTTPDPDIPVTGTPTTQQLSGSGAFVAGALIRTSNAIPSIDMALNGRTEIEFCFAWASTVGIHTYDFQVKQQDETALVYNVTPRVTTMPMNASRGF